MQQARNNDGDANDEQVDEQELAAEAQQSKRESESERAGGAGAISVTARWTQFVFFAIALTLFWILDKSANLILETFMDANPEAVTAGSLVVAGFISYRLYRHDASHRVASEIVSELTKVTWPTRKETYASSIIVIITSLIAAMIVGGFDFVWSAITDLLYKYKV